MSKSIKTFTILVAASLLLPAIASAKVYHINKYDQKKFTGDHQSKEYSGKEEGVDCAAYGWYDPDDAKAIFGVTSISSIPNNACSTMTLSDRTCYKCSCPNTYQYVCDTTGFSPATGDNGCRLRGATTTLYQDCQCNTEAGYLPPSDFNSNVLSIFDKSSGTVVSVKGNNGGKEIKCYLASGFGNCIIGGSNASVGAASVASVNGSSNSVKLSIAGEDGVEYTAKSLFASVSKSPSYSSKTFSNRYCTTAASVKSPLLNARPNDEASKCGEFRSTRTQYYPNSDYFYFDRCSDSGVCVSGDLVDCVEYETQTFTTRSGGTQTCKKAIGCSTGIPDGKNILCVAENTNIDAAFQYATRSSGGFNCKRIEGCVNPYENKFLGKGFPRESDYLSDGNYTYTVKILSSGSGAAVCAVPSGCPVGQYDFSCPTGCWGGWLSLWAKAAGK